MSAEISGSIEFPTPAPDPPVCVLLYTTDGSLFPVGATSDPGGGYELWGVPVGTYRVRFDPTCLGTTVSPYAAQFYDGAADYGSATTLNIASVAPQLGVNATLFAGASITGTVTAPGAVNAANICVEAVDALNGYVVRLATTDPAGAYDLTNLPAATYKVVFDPACENTSKSDFALGWYSGNVSFSTATR